ncbi:MAG: recombinase family protein, partial [Lachnospiraceae bacterium]|nr:recombinase family protein [Lachnospiraceae bacterium]
MMARIKDRTRQEIKAGTLAKSPARGLLLRTATYARLSVDSAVTESDSITSQQMLMRDYIKGRDEFFLVKEYKDDGISGTRFDRQAFDSLLGEVRKGNINCIIVK